MTMENMNIVTAEQQAPNTISASNAIFNVQALPSFRPLPVDGTGSRNGSRAPTRETGGLHGYHHAGYAVGMNPYAVAQKTHLVNGVLGYEAQLVNAVISSSNAIVGRFHYEYDGDWSKCATSREEIVKKPAKGGGRTTRKKWCAAGGADERLSVRVGAVIRGESEITWGEPVFRPV
jgi:hypothetical protein